MDQQGSDRRLGLRLVTVQGVGRLRDLGRQLDDAGGDLDEVQAQDVELGAAEARAPGPGGAQPPHQPVCSGVQEEAELVGGRSRA